MIQQEETKRKHFPNLVNTNAQLQNLQDSKIYYMREDL